MTTDNEILTTLKRFEGKLDQVVGTQQQQGQTIKDVSNEVFSLKTTVSDLDRAQKELARKVAENELAAVKHTDLQELQRKHADELKIADEHFKKAQHETLEAVKGVKEASTQAVEVAAWKALAAQKLMHEQTLQAVATTTAAQNKDASQKFRELVTRQNVKAVIEIVVLILGAIGALSAAKGH